MKRKIETSGDEQQILAADVHRNDEYLKFLMLKVKRRHDHCDGKVKLFERKELEKSASSTSTEVIGSKDGCLPEWFLVEILSRLPIKYMFRFKCVSRQWLSVISHPSFGRFCISRASASSVSCPSWIFVYERMHFEGSVTTHFPEHIKPLEVTYPGNLTSPDFHILPLPKSQEVKGRKHRMYLIRAVNNGFMLYAFAENKQHSDNLIAEYYICNPLTQQWFPIPSPKHSFRQVSEGFITQVDEGILRSYKVVLLHCCREKRNFLQFEIFSSEMGRWEEFTVYCECAIQVAYHRKPAVLNKNLHWVDCELGIIAYGPYDSPDKFRIIEFPADVDKEYNKSNYGSTSSMCGVHQGRLKYFEVSRPFQRHGFFSEFKIWVLEDYNSDQWYLEHRVRIEDILFGDGLNRDRYIAPVSFHPFDAHIVYLGWKNILVSYNIQTRRLDALGFPHNPGKIDQKCHWSCWECFLLVLPLWPVCIPPSLALLADDY